MTTDLRLSQDLYDDEALNTYNFQGFHYPTAILDDCMVIVAYEKDRMDTYEAEDILREFLRHNSRKNGVMIFIHEFTGKLMRVSIDSIGFIDKIQLN